MLIIKQTKGLLPSQQRRNIKKKKHQKDCKSLRNLSEDKNLKKEIMLTMKKIFQMHTKKKMNKKLYYKRKKLLMLSNVKN